MMLQHIVSVVVVAVSCLFASEAWAVDLVLADGGKSAYKIVVADNASPSTKHGAEELQRFLQQISGADLPIISDQQPKCPKEIIIGDNAHLKGLSTTIDLTTLGKEGYVIRTVGDDLVIVGGAVRGNLYGVYGFLEDHLGCRWFTPSVSHIPKFTHLAIRSIDDCQVPSLEFREPHLADCFDGDWCARNRMNSSGGRLEEKHGGKIQVWSLCHSFAELVPPEKHFKEHPEYFSLVNGKRIGYGQLCCTNPEVIHLCTEGIRQAMRTHPQAMVFSVSQNDCDNHCECPNCQAVAQQEDSQMGPVLQLVNRVAEAVEKEFPDKTVQTLAYQWTRKVPKQMRPRPGVVIMLCSIECCFSHPLATCNSPYNKAFRVDIEAWAKVAPRLWIWDYTTDFSHFLLPFPNQRVLSPNIRFFVAHNVKGIFEQDTHQTTNSELAELSGYLIAKSLWNPKYDLNRATSEFLRGYYLQASVPIQQYIDLLHNLAERENIHVRNGDGPDSPHLTDELLVKSNELWQQAENLVATSPEVLRRVQLSRMSVDYAILERARLQAQKKLPVNETVKSLAAKRFKPFFEVLTSSGLTRLKLEAAWNAPPLDKEAYRRDLANELGLTTK